MTAPERWISVADTALLLKIKPATVISRIEKGSLPGSRPEAEPFTYDGKPNYVVNLNALPHKLQYKYLVSHLPPEELCSVNLVSPRSALGHVWIDQFLNVADILKKAAMIRSVYKGSKEITKHLRELAEENGISLPTLYRL